MRNSTGAVVQFLYGEDGMDGTAIESQRVEHLRMDAQRFRVRAPLSTLTLLAHESSFTRWSESRWLFQLRRKLQLSRLFVYAFHRPPSEGV